MSEPLTMPASMATQKKGELTENERREADRIGRALADRCTAIAGELFALAEAPAVDVTRLGVLLLLLLDLVGATPPEMGESLAAALRQHDRILRGDGPLPLRFRALAAHWSAVAVGLVPTIEDLPAQVEQAPPGAA